MAPVQLSQVGPLNLSLAGHAAAADINETVSSCSRLFPMTDIILHHYAISPYSEKIRLGLGFKGLAWASVEMPAIMPKPDLTALTGGYRKAPVMQIGADIYCDSQRIMRELERRFPTPSFYPVGQGAADALAWWAEKTTFSPAAGLLFAKKPEILPAGFLEDRVKFSGRNIDPVAMMAAVPNLLDQLRAHFDWLDQMLGDGRSFLQGSAAGLADLGAYHPVWFLRQNFGSAPAPLDGFPRLLAWADRIAAIGHGRPGHMSARQALAIARDATSSTNVAVDPGDPIGRKPGQIVSVTPDDTGRDPVVGELVASNVHEIAIRRTDPAVGEVCVHFPRAGFVVAPA
jgi:glutathione S-transferase